MSENHNGGNAIPEITREEHDGLLNAKRTSLVSTVTIYAVVNTSAPGVSNSIVTIANTPLSTQIVGNVTLSGPLPTGLNSIGFATVAVSTPTIFAVVNTSAPGITNSIVTVANTVTVSVAGNVTLSDSKTFIGLTTTILGNNSVQSFGQFFPVLPSIASGGLGPVALDNFGRQQVKVTADGNVFIGLATVNIGSSNTVVLGAGVGNIGFATVNQVNQPALVAGTAYVGLASVNIGGTLPALAVGTNFIGLVTVVQSSSARTITGNLTLSDSKAYIGLNTVTVGVGTQFIGLVTVVQSSSARTITGNLTLSDSKGFIGLATTVNGAGTQFIGLVTAWTRNAGSAKTLVPVPFAFGASVATIAVPTNANVMYITNMILSANATTQVRMKSGVTYMTGNASIGISLNPNGGYVLTGAPDSPSWIGCPSGAVVLEKNDATTLVGGHLIYFQE